MPELKCSMAEVRLPEFNGDDTLDLDPDFPPAALPMPAITVAIDSARVAVDPAFVSMGI